MFHAMGMFIYRHRVATVVVAGLFLLGSLALLLRERPLASAVVHGLESEKADRLVEAVSGRRPDTTFAVLFQSDSLDPRSQPFKDELSQALAPLRLDPRVSRVEAPADVDARLGLERLAVDHKAALAFVTLKGEPQEAFAAYPQVRDELKSRTLSITCTGQIPFFHDLAHTLEKDLARAEWVSLPLALLVLLLVFRTAVAAVLPLGVGGLAVAGGIAIVFGLSNVMDVAQFTINVCSLVGLGVAIDYSLFTVSRYREELAAGRGYPEALACALDRVGWVVASSSLAVVTGLCGLTFFERSYLFAMGVGGAIVVALAALFALTFLPALLAILGPRIHALKLPVPKWRWRDRFWQRIAERVMRRPVMVLVPTLAVLLAIGAPFLRIRLAASNVEVLPKGEEARTGFELLKRAFPDEGETRFTVAVRFPSGPVWTAERIGALYDLSARLAALPGVRKVRSVAYGDPRLSRELYQELLTAPPPAFAPLLEAAKAHASKDGVVLLEAVTQAAPESEEARGVVRAIRAQRAVGDGTLLVGGESAVELDVTDYLVSRAPAAVAFVMLTTFVIVCLLLGSIVLAIKAVVMNSLSIVGSFGAMVFLFQEGHLGLADAHPLEPTLPVLLFCILFGLSMDYELLILNRVKEVWSRTKDNVRAVGEGLEKTAGVVTSAAAIMIAVFLSFGLSQVVIIKAVGVGMGVAVALDATLVRVLLVPATMRLLGRANWWEPRWLHALRVALGLEPKPRSTAPKGRGEVPPTAVTPHA